MVFEYADGSSLRRYLSDTSVELDWLARCKLGINIIDGLRHLHELDILHKNLVTTVVKRSFYNIILFRIFTLQFATWFYQSSQSILIQAGVAKLTDFGLSDPILQQKSRSDVQGTLPILTLDACMTLLLSGIKSRIYLVLGWYCGKSLAGRDCVMDSRTITIL